MLGSNDGGYYNDEYSYRLSLECDATGVVCNKKRHHNILRKDGRYKDRKRQLEDLWIETYKQYGIKLDDEGLVELYMKVFPARKRSDYFTRPSEVISGTIPPRDFDRFEEIRNRFNLSRAEMLRRVLSTYLSCAIEANPIGEMYES